MTVLVGVGDVVSAATALAALRERGVSAADIVVLVGDMDHGSEVRPDPRTVPEMAALLAGVRRVESLNTLIWPQVPQGWRASDLLVDGVGRLLVELEDTLEELIVADDHPAWKILARASRGVRVTRLAVGPGAAAPASDADVAALLAPLRSRQVSSGAAVWVPNGSTLVDRDVAELEALLTVAARDGHPVQVLVRDLPSLPHGWFDEVPAGELLREVTLITADVAPEVALLRHPVETLVTRDPVLAARAGLLGVPHVRLVDGAGQDSGYAMMVPPTGRPGRTSEGQDAVKDDQPRDRVPAGPATRQFRLSTVGVLFALGALAVGAVAVVLVDSLLGGAAAVATTALLLGGLGIALAAAVVWEIRAHRHEVRAGRRRLEATLRDLQVGVGELQKGMGDLGTSLRELREQHDEHRAQLAAIEQRGIVIAAMQERNVVATEDIARVAALLAVDAEIGTDRPGDR
ncbi:hypothetical protein GA707_17110 [Nostocoides sp. F2B08]|uniref:hypothetical protein n=1 Tax=Nostocoides sp. F2B08 TaxID=2653936 RepID=UPI001263D60A|nr:hypothetical protein [Tetrasphaera sp. F2B08]KAB7741921.1 hypothetical protein GA707_17110 [Tetrasphaera sp. F2B08]